MFGQTGSVEFSLTEVHYDQEVHANIGSDESADSVS
jgi:hypothetical protein